MVFELLQAFVVVDIVRMFSVEEEEEEEEAPEGTREVPKGADATSPILMS